MLKHKFVAEVVAVALTLSVVTTNVKAEKLGSWNWVNYTMSAKNGCAYDPNVERLQRRLNEVLGTNLKADGLFGWATKEAVIKYQSENNIVMDGIVGYNTWNALDRHGKTTTKLLSFVSWIWE